MQAYVENKLLKLLEALERRDQSFVSYCKLAHQLNLKVIQNWRWHCDLFLSFWSVPMTFTYVCILLMQCGCGPILHSVFNDEWWRFRRCVLRFILFCVAKLRFMDPLCKQWLYRMVSCRILKSLYWSDYKSSVSSLFFHCISACEAIQSAILICGPPSLYKATLSVAHRPSVCPSVPCLRFTRNRRAVEYFNLVGTWPWIRVTGETYLKYRGQRSS